MYCKLKLLFILVPFLTVSGCSTNITLTRENKTNIHNIYFDSRIKAPSRVCFLTNKDQEIRNISNISPAIGLVLAMGNALASDKEIEAIKRQVNDPHTNVQEIIKNHLILQFNRIQGLKLVTSSQISDAQLFINIKENCFQEIRGSNKFFPLLVVSAALKKQGKTIWSNEASSTPYALKLPRFTLSELNKNPEVIVKMWSDAANVVNKQLVSTI